MAVFKRKTKGGVYLYASINGKQFYLGVPGNVNEKNLAKAVKMTLKVSERSTERYVKDMMDYIRLMDKDEARATVEDYKDMVDRNIAKLDKQSKPR